MRRLLILALLTATSLTAALTIVFTSSSPLAPQLAVHSVSAALATAEDVLSEVVLPSSERSLPNLSPDGLDAVARSYGFPEPGPVQQYEYRQVPISTAGLVSFIGHHAPSGLSSIEPSSIGVGELESGEVTLRYSSESYALMAAGVPYTQLTYGISRSVANPALALVFIGVAVNWSVPRPVDEEVPADTHFVRVTQTATAINGHVLWSKSVGTSSQAAIADLRKVIAALQVEFPDANLSCVDDVAEQPSLGYSYQIAFATSGRSRPSFTVTDNQCTDATVEANGRPLPRLRNVLIYGVRSSYAFSEAVEQVFSPGVPLRWAD
jgi:hypothetical protein